LLAIALIWFSFEARSEHNALLPKPQKVHYGKAALSVANVNVAIARPFNEEDLFAAQELASRLTSLTGNPVQVLTNDEKGPTILLKRTGEAPALPTDNEKVGPGTRESYSININSKGAGIRAPSSAGLFYGVQTLIQMVERAGTNAVLPAGSVEDWPTLAYRGMMMDFSEGELVRVSEVERQLDLLA